MHSLARVPANRDCYQLISASSRGGQPYWQCNDSSPVWVAASVAGPCRSDSIINTQTLGSNSRVAPRWNCCFGNAAITWADICVYCVQTDQSRPNGWPTDFAVRWMTLQICISHRVPHQHWDIHKAGIIASLLRSGSGKGDYTSYCCPPPARLLLLARSRCSFFKHQAENRAEEALFKNLQWHKFFMFVKWWNFRLHV